eukprot:TRINITY_DN26756_c0_g2_i1.p1 TRINITY_DN26756_c0_g2~~TRINITY_DN26756_c0_g2_i1.p1  ORF type:complete len:514 (-),score=119.88 TRINITY_DN26756_c0_g2_i1:465-2006(-)
MPGLDYSRFDGLGDSESEAEHEEPSCQEASCDEVLAGLPEGLSKELSLVLAARQGQANLVEALLQARVDANVRDPHGGTPLLRAIEASPGPAARPVVELLLKARADPAAADTTRQTPLMVAAGSGSPELLSALLDAAAVVPTPEALGAALGSAAQAGQKATSSLLLRAGAPAGAASVLHTWAKLGDLDMLQELLDRRADLGAQCERGDNGTPLLWAAGSDCRAALGAARWLLERRAEPDAASRDGTTPLVRAAGKSGAEASEMVKLLLDFQASPQLCPTFKAASPLVSAALEGRTEAAKLLLEARACATSADGSGRRPLPCAAAAGSAELCTALLRARAEVDGLGTSGVAGNTGDGVTALSVAVGANHRALVELLLEARANLELPNERGQRPLMAAASAGRAELCTLLLGARAEPCATQEGDQKTALIFAAGSGAAEVCELLLLARADPAHSSTGGAAALHAAAANGHREVCKLLRAAGADTLQLGPGGKAAAALAAGAGHADLAAELEKLTS